MNLLTFYKIVEIKGEGGENGTEVGNGTPYSIFPFCFFEPVTLVDLNSKRNFSFISFSYSFKVYIAQK